MQNNNLFTPGDITRQVYKGPRPYKSFGSIGPTNVGDYYQSNAYNWSNDNITISATIANSWISPISGTIDKIYFFNRNSAGTHYPIQLSLYETADPTLNALTWTKLAQSGDITTTTDGLKILSGAAVPVTQGYGYFIGFHRKNTGGSTSPLVVGRTSGFNNVFSNISASDLSNATPASFTTTISTNTVAGWTAGSSVANAIWFMVVFQ